MAAAGPVHVRALDRSSSLPSRRDPFERDASRASKAIRPMSLDPLPADHAARQGARVHPAFQTRLGDGIPLDADVMTPMEARLGFNFEKVRVHADATAADANARMRSNAYAMGSNIAFARGRYEPHTAAGRELIAHELAHVVQQRNHESVQLDDASPLGGSVLTMDWDVQFKLNRPTPAEMGADPATVLTDGGVSMLGLIQSSLAMNSGLDAELEGNASIEGPPEHNQQLSERRARYLAQRIGIGRVRDVPNRPHMCTPIEDGLYGCGTQHAHSTVDPSDRRVRVSMFTPQAGGRLGFPTITSNPPVDKKRAGPPEATGSNQWSGSAGLGYTRHLYLTQPGATDPINEAVIQFVGAYTRQFHGEGKKGLEFQVPVQLQVSLTTGAVSVAGGGQLSYVLPFGRNKWQWSAFAQTLAGGAFSSQSSSLQFQPSIGTQIQFQPLKWLQLQGQASAGFTVQTGGPASADFGGIFIIQFVN